jgi:peptidoglycan hydrolase CwlO-like protein
LGKASPSWAQRRLRSFERRNSQLEHELTVANAAIRKISDERDQLKRRLEQAEGNISILQDGIAVSKPRESRATALLNPEDRALLTQLRNAPDISLDDGVDIASAAE